MKKLLFILSLLLLPLLASAQETKSRVVLKNGTKLTGILKSVDPTDAIKIVIAGVETTIKMADIDQIEEIDETPSNITPPATASNGVEEKLKVTDFADYPESFEIKIDDQTIKMILVRGGEMNMGYNGKGSLKLKSEPVHKVRVTSFYVSECYIPNIIAKKVDNDLRDKKNIFYSECSYDKQKAVADYIANESKIPVRLITEAEWEYAACSDKQLEIFGKNADFEMCSDWFDSFTNNDVSLDPTGPLKGKRRVFRSYGKFSNKFNRSRYAVASSIAEITKSYARLVVKAVDLRAQ